MLTNKPTFGTSPTISETTTPAKKAQEEIGAIWNRVAKNATNYMVVRFNKAKLKELLAKLPDDQENVSLVAFANKGQQGDPKRPAFRVFEEEKK